MAAPIPSASRGVPPVVVTVTGSLNSTVASIASPARKTPPAPFARPERVSPVTVGSTTSAAPPATTRSPSVTAWTPRPSAAALFAASAIVPPFSASAEAPMPTPFESVSPETTA